MKQIAIIAVFAALLAGCVGVKTSEQGKGMVYVQNENLLIFNCFPLCSGDPDYPNEEVASWWENTLTVKNNLRLAEEAMEEKKARGLTNIASYPRDEWIFWPLLKRHILSTSAELVR